MWRSIRASSSATESMQTTLYFVRRYPLGAIGAAIMAIFVLTALFAGTIAPFDPTATDASASLARPGGVPPPGARPMGRDVFSRIVHGARISLAVGLCATALGCLIGVAIGLASGYLGGSFDLLVQRLIDILQSLPLLVMALVMAASLGPSLTHTIIAIAIPLVPRGGGGVPSHPRVAGGEPTPRGAGGEFRPPRRGAGVPPGGRAGRGCVGHEPARRRDPRPARSE